MKCYNCPNQATDKHHIIFKNKTQGGTDSPDNLVYLCRQCHDLIHHSKNTNQAKELKARLYRKIKPVLSNCWLAKIKPKIINQIEAGDYD